MILTHDIGYIGDLDDREKAPELDSTTGLGVIDFSPLPHFGNPKYVDKYFEILRNNLDDNICLLRDDQAIETHDGLSFTVRSSLAVDDSDA